MDNENIDIDVGTLLSNYDALLAQTNHTLMVAKAELTAWKTECIAWRKKDALSAKVQEEPKGE